MNKPSISPIYFPPITRRPIKYPSFKATLPSVRPTTIPTITKTTTHPTTKNITIIKTFLQSSSKLSQSSQIIIIVPASIIFLCCVIGLCFIYDKRDRKRRQEGLQDWLHKDANIKIYLPTNFTP